MITGLDHVQVAGPPGCEDAARAFYGEILGLAEVEKPPPLADRGGLWFRLGPHELHIGVEDPFSPAAKAHPALRVPARADLEVLARRLSASGHEVVWDEALTGVDRFYLADPFGNRLELTTPAAGPLTLAMVAQIPQSGVEEFVSYEAKVLPLLGRHGGTLIRRDRSVDGTQEVHVVTFPSRAAYRAYRDDLERVALQPMLERSQADVAVMEVVTAT